MVYVCATFVVDATLILCSWLDEQAFMFMQHSYKNSCKLYCDTNRVTSVTIHRADTSV